MHPIETSHANLFIISGTSGSGKTLCLQVLEDLGYYCIDNLPVSLLNEMAHRIQATQQNCAISIDCRNFDFIGDLNHSFEYIKSLNIHCRILYLDANNQTLLQRYSETRRKHPLSDKHTALLEAINIERKQLEFIVNSAEHTINTSDTTPHELKSIVKNLSRSSQKKTLVLQFQSFGFKYGSPEDADFMFDVRCLPNPYWDTDLRPLTGLDAAIEAYFSQYDLCHNMLEQIAAFIEFWTPHFIKENRNYITIAIGCTGGKHRSVYLSNQLYSRFKESDIMEVQIRHREIPF